MKQKIEVRLGLDEQEWPEALIGSGKSQQKPVWRARQRLKRGVFRGIVDLQAAIN
jgi:hypothetical protein